MITGVNHCLQMLMGCGSGSQCEADSVWSPFAAWLQDKLNNKDADLEARINAVAADLHAKLTLLNTTCCKDDAALVALIAAANAKSEATATKPQSSGDGWLSAGVGASIYLSIWMCNADVKEFWCTDHWYKLGFFIIILNPLIENLAGLV